RDQTLSPPRTISSPHRMAVTDGHPQPRQAPQRPTSHSSGLTALTRGYPPPTASPPPAPTNTAPASPPGLRDSLERERDRRDRRERSCCRCEAERRQTGWLWFGDTEERYVGGECRGRARAVGGV